jgi:hypothetical protein
MEGGKVMRNFKFEFGEYIIETVGQPEFMEIIKELRQIAPEMNEYAFRMNPTVPLTFAMDQLEVKGVNQPILMPDIICYFYRFTIE